MRIQKYGDALFHFKEKWKCWLIPWKIFPWVKSVRLWNFLEQGESVVEGGESSQKIYEAYWRLLLYLIFLGKTPNEPDPQNAKPQMNWIQKRLDTVNFVFAIFAINPLTSAPNRNACYGSGASSQPQVEFKENGMVAQKRPKPAQVNCAHKQKNWHKSCSSGKFRDSTL